MNTPGEVLHVERQTRALLALVESNRQRQASQILDEARQRAAAIRTQAHAQAREQMRQAFAEQRQRHQERLAAAQAQLATQRRLHEQQRIAALLQRAWQRLPDELVQRWQQPATRAAWVAQVLAEAAARLPSGPWQIVHAVDWPTEERENLATQLASRLGSAPRFAADASIAAGFKVMAQGNVIDGTLQGLVADRSEFESLLLRELEKQA